MRAGLLHRPIEGEWPYVWLDATYVRVRQNGRIVSVAVIIAVGVEFVAADMPNANRLTVRLMAVIAQEEGE